MKTESAVTPQSNDNGNPVDNSDKEEPDNEEPAEEDSDKRPAENIDGDTPIDVLDLSIRSYNCLMRAGIDNMEKLLKMTDEDFSKVRNLGRKSTEEIKHRLAEHNYVLNPPEEYDGPSYSEQLDSLIGLNVLIAEDFTEPSVPPKDKKSPFGFCA